MNVERLAEILADMVRSALAWEKKNGAPPAPKTKQVLTVYTGTYTLASHKATPGGEQNDGNGDKGSKSGNDV